MNADTFGPTLKRLREQRRISQSKLADWIDVDHSFVSRLESGQRNPSRETCDDLIRVLKLAAHDAADLVHAAGYLGDGEDAELRVLRDDLTIATVLRILTDPALPDDWLTFFRHSIDHLAASSRFVRREEAA